MPVLTSIDPAEMLIIEGEENRWRAQAHDGSVHDELIHFLVTRSVTEMPGFQFDIDSGAQSVMDTLGVINLEGFGIEKKHAALGCAGALLYYVTENLRAKPENLSTIREYSTEITLLIDPATLRNLEIFKSMRGTRDGSLLQAINKTNTAAGARQLEQWLIAPERNLAELNRRQDSIGEFVGAPMAVYEIQDLLKSVRDIKRILGRMQNRLRNPRELGGIRDSLNQLPEILNSLNPFVGTAIDAISNKLHSLPHLAELLNKALKDELPNNLNDGDYMAQGYDESLDEMLSLTTGNKLWLANLETEERARTGIKNLKIKFNNAFGYFIEISKSNLGNVPKDYIRKQTMVNGERFVTDSLKEKEKEIMETEIILEKGVLLRFLNLLIMFLIKHVGQCFMISLKT